MPALPTEDDEDGGVPNDEMEMNALEFDESSELR